MYEPEKINLVLEYKGCCPAGMVVVDENISLIIFILNIFFPSMGTFMASCFDKEGCNCTTAAFGILQFLLCLCYGLGWFWSVFYGFSVWEYSRR